MIGQPYIGMILDGQKTWEMRSRRSHRRGQIALIQSGSLTVIGVADAVDCIGPLTDEQRLESEDLHCVLPETWMNPRFVQYRFAWVLTNAQRLVKPVPYHHNPGAVQWVSLEESVSNEVARVLSVSR